MSDTEKYEELCRALVGIDANERFSHEEIVNIVYKLKDKAVKHYDRYDR